MSIHEGEKLERREVFDENNAEYMHAPTSTHTRKHVNVTLTTKRCIRMSSEQCCFHQQYQLGEALADPYGEEPFHTDGCNES